MLEVSRDAQVKSSYYSPQSKEQKRDAVKEEEEQLVSCAAEKSEYSSICTVTLDPCGDLPFTSWGRWQCLRGGADGSNGRYVACGCGTYYRCGAMLG